MMAAESNYIVYSVYAGLLVIEGDVAIRVGFARFRDLTDRAVSGRQSQIDFAEDLADARPHRCQHEHCRSSDEN